MKKVNMLFVAVLTLSLIFSIISVSNAFYSSNNDGLKIGGDIRYRYEDVDDGSKPSNEIRVRIKLNDFFKNGFGYGIRLNSGNNTLNGNDGKKGFSDIYFDRVYLSFKSNDAIINGGRMPTPFYQPGSSELLFDNDYNPEGVSAKYSLDVAGLYISGIGAYLQSNVDKSGNITKTELDTDMYAGQLIFEKKILGADVCIGTGYYFVEDTTNQYQQYFVEVKDIFTLPLNVYGDYSENNGNEGCTVGVSTKYIDKVSLTYAYANIEEGSVDKNLTDDDVYDHKFGVNYKLFSNIKCNVNFFTNNDVDYTKYQVNLTTSF